MKIKELTAELLNKQTGIEKDDIMFLFDIGIIEEHTCRKYLIRDEYFCKIPRQQKTIVKIELAEKYNVSFNTVEKYIQIKT